MPSAFIKFILLVALIFGISFQISAQCSAADDFIILGANPHWVSPNDTNAYAGGFDVVTFPSHLTWPGWYNDYGAFSSGPVPWDYVGSDTFSYTACDGQSNTASVTVLILGNDERMNLGASCPISRGVEPTAKENFGQPINVTTGNMWLQQTDYSLPGLGETIEINRFYNSRSDDIGLFGLGWSTKYDEKLVSYDAGMLRVDMPDGRGVYFGRPNTSVDFRSISVDVKARVTKELDNTYTLKFQDGRIHRFDQFGKLLSQKDRYGNETVLGLDQNNNPTVTDPAGRKLTLIPNASGQITQITDSVGVIANYTYTTGTNRLESASYPDGSQYHCQQAFILDPFAGVYF